MKLLALALLILGMSFAQTQQYIPIPPSQQPIDLSNVATPSDPSYVFVSLGRGIHLFVTDVIGSDSDKVQARLEIIQQLQFEKMKAQNDSVSLTKISDDENRLENETDTRIAMTSDPNERQKELAEIQSHQMVLQKIIYFAPPQAIPGLQNAINKSSKNEDELKSNRANLIALFPEIGSYHPAQNCAEYGGTWIMTENKIGCFNIGEGFLNTSYICSGPLFDTAKDRCNKAGATAKCDAQNVGCFNPPG